MRGFLLQRFAGYLNHINRVGDVMGESRGGREDRLLNRHLYDKRLEGYGVVLFPKGQ